MKRKSGGRFFAAQVSNDDEAHRDDEDNEARSHEADDFVMAHVVDFDGHRFTPRTRGGFIFKARAEIVGIFNEPGDISAQVFPVVKFDGIREIFGFRPLKDDDCVFWNAVVNRPDEFQVAFGRFRFVSGLNELNRRQRLRGEMGSACGKQRSGSEKPNEFS